MLGTISYKIEWWLRFKESSEERFNFFFIIPIWSTIRDDLIKKIIFIQRI